MIVLVCFLGLLLEAVRVVRPGQVMMARGLTGRYGVGAAPRIVGGDSIALHLVPVLPLGPTLRLTEEPTGGSAGKSRLLDRQRARTAISRLDRAGPALTAAGLMMFLLLTVWAPFVLLGGRIRNPWEVLGVSLALVDSFLLTAFYLAHRRLHPDAGGRRWQNLLEMLLFPPAGVFVAERAVEGVMAGVHPLVAAFELDSVAESRRLAGHYLRAWAHPLPDRDPADASELLAAARSLLAAEGLDPEAMLAPPAPDGPLSVAYCPLCLCQYTVPGGDCPDCPGVKKVRFEEAV